MNTELTTKARGDFQKDFFNLMSNPIFVRKHKDIKLLGEKLFYCRSQTIRQQKFLQIFLAIEISLWKLDLTKIVMYEYWCDYKNPNFGEKAKLCYTGTNSLIVNIK